MKYEVSNFIFVKEHGVKSLEASRKQVNMLQDKLHFVQGFIVMLWRFTLFLHWVITMSHCVVLGCFEDLDMGHFEISKKAK
jgi:hypothetical protein